jgi:flagellar basal-body rod protein FlgB
MWIDRLTSSRTTHAAELAARFAEARHQVLAENAANLDTPDYHTRTLDPQAFSESLHQALQRAEKSGQNRLELRGNAQFATGPDGRLRVRPTTAPAPNVLFHDGTNARLETLAADLNQNALLYELSTTFLRYEYRILLNAIRGKLT